VPKQCGRLSSADDEAFQLSSAQLNSELRTQVSNTFKSASLISTVTNEQYHFVSSSDRFPVPDVCSLRIYCFVCWTFSSVSAKRRSSGLLLHYLPVLEIDFHQSYHIQLASVTANACVILGNTGWAKTVYFRCTVLIQPFKIHVHVKWNGFHQNVHRVQENKNWVAVLHCIVLSYLSLQTEIGVTLTLVGSIDSPLS